MKILLTAFDPFNGEPVNPAMEAVALVPDRIEGAEIVRLTVPTVFRRSVEVVISAVEKVHPDVVLCVGQAGGRRELTPERVAINLDDAAIPDNEGNQPVDQPIFPDGAPAYFSTLPVKAMVRAIRAAGLPACLSDSAGTFVCNHLMYGLLYTLEKRFPGVRGGFLHVPYTPEQAVLKEGVPYMNVRDIACGIEAAIRAISEE